MLVLVLALGSSPVVVVSLRVCVLMVVVVLRACVHAH